MKPPHLCSCGAVVAHGTLCACQVERKRQRDQRHDARRPSASQRGYDSKWRRVRREWLALHPFCALCGAEAQAVDHITPHRGDKAVFWDFANWQSLCTPCHSRAKQRIERAADAGHV